jgi:hypothetical protein
MAAPKDTGKFPLTKCKDSSAARREVNHTTVEKLFYLGEEKEIPAIKRTGWTNLETSPAL